LHVLTVAVHVPDRSVSGRLVTPARMLTAAGGIVDAIGIACPLAVGFVETQAPVGIEVVRRHLRRRRPAGGFLPPPLPHPERVNRLFVHSAGIDALEVVIEEAQQFRVVVETRLAGLPQGVQVPSAPVIPRTEDEPATGGGYREVALDGSIRIGAIKPAAI